MTDFLRELRPSPRPAFEVRFETPPGDQAQVDFAHFEVIFTDEPSATPRGVVGQGGVRVGGGCSQGLLIFSPVAPTFVA